MRWVSTQTAGRSWHRREARNLPPDPHQASHDRHNRAGSFRLAKFRRVIIEGIKDIATRRIDHRSDLETKIPFQDISYGPGIVLRGLQISHMFVIVITDDQSVVIAKATSA